MAFKKLKFTNIFFILSVGLFVRLIFTWFFAENYYGIENFFCQGDTKGWAYSFQNLYEKSIYAYNVNVEYSHFLRIPGYSFFLGFFYLLCGKDWTVAYKVCGYTQIFIDVFNIYLIKIIAQKVYQNIKISSLAAWIFALYPFAIVWNPVCYSEILSLHLLLLSVWFFVKKDDKKINLFWCGFTIALSALVRPQIAIIFPVFGITILFQKVTLTLKLKQALIYGTTVFCIFGIWPARNYINHNKFVLMQDLRGSSNWHGEVLAFTAFMYSAQSDWEPQFTQILKNQQVKIPEHFIGTKQDSIKLLRAFELCKTNGVSFSYWKGYWQNKIVTDSSKLDSMVNAFTELREMQVQQHPFIFYVILPIENLKKAIFKTSLYDTKSMIRKIASSLFVLRTLLIFLGVFGCILMFRKNEYKSFALLLFSYWSLLYLALCAGTGPMFRNIEVRYFLHPDVLLLIPASYFIYSFYSKYFSKQRNIQTNI